MSNTATEQKFNLKAEWYIRAEDINTGELVHEERKREYYSSCC